MGVASMFLRAGSLRRPNLVGLRRSLPRSGVFGAKTFGRLCSLRQASLGLPALRHARGREAAVGRCQAALDKGLRVVRSQLGQASLVAGRGPHLRHLLGHRAARRRDGRGPRPDPLGGRHCARRRRDRWPVGQRYLTPVYPLGSGRCRLRVGEDRKIETRESFFRWFATKRTGQALHVLDRFRLERQLPSGSTPAGVRYLRTAHENMTSYASSASTHEGSPLLVRRFEPSASSTEITLAIERCKRLLTPRIVNVSTGMLFLNCHKGVCVAGGSSRRFQPEGALTLSTNQTSCCLRLRIRFQRGWDGSARAESSPILQEMRLGVWSGKSSTFQAIRTYRQIGSSPKEDLRTLPVKS